VLPIFFVKLCVAGGGVSVYIHGLYSRSHGCCAGWGWRRGEKSLTFPLETGINKGTVGREYRLRSNYWRVCSNMVW